jgi:polygalacturonase
MSRSSALHPDRRPGPGINPQSWTNVTIAHCYIHAGDDNVAISSRPGAPATHISILDDHFYTGHGMSIGSATGGGVSHVLVSNLSIDGAANGIRIKSDPRSDASRCEYRRSRT